MSIVQASRLTSSDIAHLGNNLLPKVKVRRQYSVVKAVNRSLNSHGESIQRLYAFGDGRRSR